MTLKICSAKVTNGLKILAESLIIRKIQYIVINYINLFVFDDEIEMKNRRTIQTLTFVQTNPDHLYMKLVVVHAIIHCFGSKTLAPCKHFSWLLNWHLKMAPGDFSGSYFLGARAAHSACWSSTKWTSSSSH